MREVQPFPNPSGMDRNGADYKAAVRAAVADCPPLDGQQRVTLRAIFTGSAIMGEPQRRMQPCAEGSPSPAAG